MKKTLLFILVVSLLYSTGALAGSHTVVRSAPEPQTSMDGIQFISGGIGITEREILDQMAEKYTLKVVLAGRGGHYLSRCDVEIIRTDGTKIVSTTTNGPWLLADLEPGDYRVKAQHDSTWKSQKVTVSADALQQVVFNW
jgi:hypothetical protein